MTLCTVSTTIKFNVGQKTGSERRGYKFEQKDYKIS